MGPGSFTFGTVPNVVFVLGIGNSVVVVVLVLVIRDAVIVMVVRKLVLGVVYTVTVIVEVLAVGDAVVIEVPVLPGSVHTLIHSELSVFHPAPSHHPPSFFPHRFFGPVLHCASSDPDEQ